MSKASAMDNPSPLGKYRSGRPFALVMLGLLLCAQTRAGEVTDVTSHDRLYPFGMVSNHRILSQRLYRERMIDAGARICRVDVPFDNVRRTAEEMDPDRWTWSTLEAIAASRKEFPGLDYLVILGYGAKWAEDPRFKVIEGRDHGCPQRGITVMPPWNVENLYGHYVYETVRRYKHVVQFWESWNEPDLSFFKGYGSDFFYYQKACYLAAKKADPQCKVLYAGICHPSIEGYLNTHGLPPISPHPCPVSHFEMFLQECMTDRDAKKNNYYFDIMNVHSYARATDLYDYTAVVKKLMHDYCGEEKPVWFTETGLAEKGGNHGASPVEYCDYLLQSFAWGALAGVERQFHFQLDNSNLFGLYDGMLGGPKLALFTYRDVLTKEFAEARLVAQRHGRPGIGYLEGNSPFKPTWKSGYNLFEFQRRDGKTLWMAFADTDQEVTARVPAKKANAMLVDRHNARAAIVPKDGYYTLILPGATNRRGWPLASDPQAKALGEPEHLMGGATLIIVE